VTVEFVLETSIAAAPERCFDLSLDIDLHLGSMADSNERAIAGTTAGTIGLGETVTWRARHFGIPWTMTSRIVELDRPRRFVDAQVTGPFHAFRHVHEFTRLAGLAGGTLMVDRVRFEAPFGAVGRVAEQAVLGRYLKHLIEARNRYLRFAAEAGS
jgi:ligand-binding SRPBCC domain-containing protein